LAVAGLVAPACKKSPGPEDNKLVIVKAIWGDMRNEQTADVTKIVAGQVKNNALSITANPGLLGDPAAMKFKQLRVEWSKGGILARKRASEGEALTIRADEKPANNRLVVRKAVYGNFASGKTIDVTTSVSQMVVDNALSVTPNNGIFGDPAELQFKQLRVDYAYDGAAQTKTVDELQTLKIPEGAP
jgi:hypothetical protein